jgi:DNA-binding GntR family transcriptional regulator
MKKRPEHKPLILQLANRIVDRIHSQGMPEGEHLVEQEMANDFQVSRSPVREALNILEKKKIVIFRPNRGFFLARSAVEIPKLDVEIPLSEEEQKYKQIAEDRIRGNLQGHVSEAELMSRYGISRVRLMKILMRMTQEGWLERRPGHGWNFTPILENAEALDQGYRFRMLIEPAALLEPTFRIDPLVFGRLRKEQEEILATPIDGRTPFRLYETGARFHEFIVSCSGNRYFVESIQHINRLRRLIEYSLKVDEARVEPFREHLEIMSLLERDKRAVAAALLKDHIDEARLKKIANKGIKK